MVRYLRGKGLDLGVEPSNVKYVKYTPPSRIMKVKRKKYEPLKFVFKDKARKIGDISTKAEKKNIQSTRQKGSLCSTFQEICVIQRV